MTVCERCPLFILKGQEFGAFLENYGSESGLSHFVKVCQIIY